MLTPKENFLETLKKDGKPDRLVNQYQPFVPIMNDPLQKFTRGNRVRGKTSVDRWGTEILFPEDAPGPMPHVTEANKVCPDVTRWQESVKVPDLIANCSDGWEDALSAASKVDRSEKLVLGFMGTGIFEQSHFLMGFEDALMNLLLEPESMQELVDAIAEYRFRYAKLLVDNLHRISSCHTMTGVPRPACSCSLTSGGSSSKSTTDAFTDICTTTVFWSCTMQIPSWNLLLRTWQRLVWMYGRACCRKMTF